MSTQQYDHWHTDIDENHILWLGFDRKDQAVNTMSREVMEELNFVLDHLDQNAIKGLVITSAKKTGFIAGADITQFSKVDSEEQAFNLIRQGQLVFDKLAALTIPTLALINGFCLGGGYELALACRYRVALDDPKLKIGLPEIKLGIQPGWGGTIRLPKLIGAIKAMQIILPGAVVSARRARKMGMIDAVVPERQLKRAATWYIQHKPAPHAPSFVERITNAALIRPFLAKKLRQETAKKALIEHYPAPYAVIDCWLNDFGKPEAMENEAKSISRLMMTDTARNLLRVFFLQNTMKDIAKGSQFKPKHVHVIGAGTMGGDIAAWCAFRGFQVSLQDQSPEKIAPAIERAYRLYKKKLKKDSLIQPVLDRLQPDIDGRGIKNADVIIEAVFENLEVKQAIFKKVESEAKTDAIIASNTSSIPLEEISVALAHPDRLIGIHFFNPVAKMPLVEIVHTQKTSVTLIKDAASFVKALGRSPLSVLSRPGFLVNRVLMPYLIEAVTLFDEGMSKEAIDKAAVAFGMPMGPVELADTVGLDVCLSVAQNLSQHLGAKVPAILQDKVKNGLLGVKSGEGFYRYKNRKPIKNQSTSEVNADCADRMILRMVNEAVACLHEGVVSSEDLCDAGMIFGTGFAPFRGGPIMYAKERDIDKVMDKLNQFSKQYGHRFQPQPGWDALQNGSNHAEKHGEISQPVE